MLPFSFLSRNAGWYWWPRRDPSSLLLFQWVQRATTWANIGHGHGQGPDSIPEPIYNRIWMGVVNFFAMFRLLWPSSGGTTTTTTLNNGAPSHDVRQPHVVIDVDAIKLDLRSYVDKLMAAAKTEQEIIHNTMTTTNNNNYLFQFNAENEAQLRALIDEMLTSRLEAAQFQRPDLTSKEINVVLDVLVQQMKVDDRFKVMDHLLTEENLQKIFLDLRQRFLNDNQVFLERLLNDPRLKPDNSEAEKRIDDLVSQSAEWKHEFDAIRKHLNEALQKVDADQNDKLQAAKEELMANINAMLKVKVQEIFESNIGHHGSTAATTTALNNDDGELRRLIATALRVYDADKTGLADYALESSGGQVLSTRCTENYQMKSAQISVLGIPLWYPSNTPRTAIQPNVQPGNCWAFQGFPGFLVLQLNLEVYVSGFTMEHIPKSLSNGQIASAPKAFSVWVSK